MSEEWTKQDETTYRPLRNKLLRIQAKQRRDKTRKRRYTRRVLDSSVQTNQEEKK